MSSKDIDKNFLEKRIKQALLDQQYLFKSLGDLGNYRLIFEKTAFQGKLRADALLFTEKKGIIGIEIKNEHDNLKRLPRQLSYYCRICDYVYVFCHDSHLEGVEEVIRKGGYKSYVGIISYSVYMDEVTPGIYKQAKKSPKFDLHYALTLLWKSEIRNILSTYVRHQSELVSKKLDLSHMRLSWKSFQVVAGGNAMASRRLSYRQIMANYISTFGERNGTLLLCQRYIYADMDPQHYLKLYHFGDNLEVPEVVGYEAKRLRKKQ